MADMEAIAASLNALMTNYGVTRDQIADLLGGSADGGPKGDGRYPVTRPNGDVALVPSPAAYLIDVGSVAAGLRFFNSKTDLDALVVDPAKLFLAYVRTGAGAGIYSYSGAEWQADTTYAAAVANVVQPLVDQVKSALAVAADAPAVAELISASLADRAAIEARSVVYGVANPAMTKLFAAEATELAFSDSYYRDGYTPRTLANLPGLETSGSPPVTGRGLFISGAGAAGLFRPNDGDVTVIVEADMPVLDGTIKVLASYLGTALTENVAVYRNDAGYYQMQLVRTGEATLVVTGPQDTNARRIRIAFSIGAAETRVSFAGGNVLRIASPRPTQLLRLWLGRIALGNGNPLEGYITRAAIYPHTVSNSLLQAMAGGSVTDDEVTQLIDQKIRTHDNNLEAHDLEAVRRRSELADSKTGLWSIKAADTFAGADGAALGNAETGGMAWVTNSCVRKGGRLQQPAGVSGGAWLQSGAKDGQVEADLYPGTKEASLYVRMNAAFQQWILLQRSADGGITLNIQFGGQTIRLAPLLVLPVVVGERYKVRFIGPRVWVFRVVTGAETLLFDITEPRLMTETYHGMRLDGGGSADNFRVLNREEI